MSEQAIISKIRRNQRGRRRRERWTMDLTGTFQGMSLNSTSCICWAAVKPVRHSNNLFDTVTTNNTVDTDTDTDSDSDSENLSLSHSPLSSKVRRLSRRLTFFSLAIITFRLRKLAFLFGFVPNWRAKGFQKTRGNFPYF